MASPPTVTVLLPTYNAAGWLGAAVDSVLRQSFVDFELLVMDDGSTDETGAVLGQRTDARLRVVRQANRGLVAVLNHGIELARGTYVARMDADDLAHPERLARQVAFMQAHREVGVCGTWFRVRTDRRRSRVRTPVDHDAIIAMLFFRSAFGHPTVMLRRSFLEQSGLRYDPEARHAEDFALWVRARQGTRMANIPEYLLEYRVHPAQVSAENLQTQSGAAARVRLKQLAALVLDATSEQQQMHLRVCGSYSFDDPGELLQARAWLDHLKEANREAGMFAETPFDEALAAIWADCCHRARFSGSGALRIFLSRRYSGLGLESLRRHAALVRRAFTH